MRIAALEALPLSGGIHGAGRVAESSVGRPRDASSRPRLLDKVRDALRLRHYSRRTERAYVGWIRRYILFHGKRHPADMGAPEVTRFLSALATQGGVAASTQNQALAALLFSTERFSASGSRGSTRWCAPRSHGTCRSSYRAPRFARSSRGSTAPRSSWPSCCTALASASSSARGCA